MKKPNKIGIKCIKFPNRQTVYRLETKTIKKTEPSEIPEEELLARPAQSSNLEENCQNSSVPEL